MNDWTKGQPHRERPPTLRPFVVPPPLPRVDDEAEEKDAFGRRLLSVILIIGLTLGASFAMIHALATLIFSTSRL